MRQSHGLMVNYLYKLDDIEKNHEALAQHGEVAASPEVKKWRRPMRPLPAPAARFADAVAKCRRAEQQI